MSCANLDHATPLLGLGSKMGIDGTRKIAGEADCRPWPTVIRMSNDVKRRVNELLKKISS